MATQKEEGTEERIKWRHVPVLGKGRLPLYLLVFDPVSL